jgi:hypothetical protein
MGRWSRWTALPLLAMGAGCQTSDVLYNVDRDAAGLQYTATSEVSGGARPTVTTTVTVANHTGEDVTLGVPDGCVVMIRAYATAARGGTPVGDAARFMGCTQAIVTVWVPAGGTATVRGAANAALLRGSAPAGTYYLTAVVRTSPTMELAAGEVVLPPE